MTAATARRYYTRAMVGDLCPVCHYRVPLALMNHGIRVHPMCEWEREQRAATTGDRA